jgi:glyoxylase-like metal-dependent hydrolase (beta-lactamase superfamily II)
VTEPIDLMHLGRDRVIGAYEPRPGVVVDPGPASCLDALLAGLQGEPRALLLTHIHLDHAGATGVLARRFPGVRVYVHEVGAPHLVDPTKLVASARRLYGEDMERLWGEIAPVPAESIEPLAGGETVEGMRVEYVPGHATHHVAYLDPDGSAYVGDVAGVRIPPSEFTLMPTPPPDIDLEAWWRSIELIERCGPRRLCLTHYGPVEDAPAQLDAARKRLREAGERARPGDLKRFVDDLDSQLLSEADAETAGRLRQAAPPEQLFAGLHRYWRNRAQMTDPQSARIG